MAPRFTTAVDPCSWQDCGSCYNCADKPKFGGPGALGRARALAPRPWHRARPDSIIAAAHLPFFKGRLPPSAPPPLLCPKASPSRLLARRANA